MGQMSPAHHSEHLDPGGLALTLPPDWPVQPPDVAAGEVKGQSSPDMRCPCSLGEDAVSHLALCTSVSSLAPSFFNDLKYFLIV